MHPEGFEQRPARRQYYPLRSHGRWSVTQSLMHVCKPSRPFLRILDPYQMAQSHLPGMQEFDHRACTSMLALEAGVSVELP